MTALLAALLVTGSLFVWAVGSAPAVPNHHEKFARRRRRLLAKRPALATAADIRMALVAAGMSRDDAGLVTETAARHRITPLTMWWWLQHFDAHTLGVVVAADLSHRDLLDHMESGTVPCLDELSVFAAANGLAMAGPARVGAAPALVGAHAAASDAVATQVATQATTPAALPPIFQPGDWPGEVLTVPAEWTVSEAEGLDSLADAVREVLRTDRDGEIGGLAA